MTTALQIITDALIEINAHDLGQSVPAEDAALGLRKLNQIVQRWSTYTSMFPVLPEVSVPMTGAASYTIGPSGDVTAARPIRVDRATYIDGDVEYPVRVLSRPVWDGIAVKDVGGSSVSDVWYEATAVNGTINVYPKASVGTLKLDVVSSLTTFPSLTTSLSLPEGYETALILTLAVDLSGAYERPVSGDLRARCRGAVSLVKRSNTEALIMSLGLEREDFQIERGY